MARSKLFWAALWSCATIGWLLIGTKPQKSEQLSAEVTKFKVKEIEITQEVVDPFSKELFKSASSVVVGNLRVHFQPEQTSVVHMENIQHREFGCLVRTQTPVFLIEGLQDCTYGVKAVADDFTFHPLKAGQFRLISPKPEKDYSGFTLRSN